MTETAIETENHTSKRERPVVVQFQAAPPSAPSGPRASRPEKWVALAEDGEYAEHQIRVRLRFSDTINQELGAGDAIALTNALCKIVLEHNGWLDPEKDEPTTLPSVDQPCQFNVRLDKALLSEAVEYQAALKEAAVPKDQRERAVAQAAAESAHQARVQQLRLEAITEKAVRRDPLCCFWDSLSQEEYLLILKAVRVNKRDRISFLLGTSGA
jgi:hypothetical protein